MITQFFLEIGKNEYFMYSYIPHYTYYLDNRDYPNRQFHCGEAKRVHGITLVERDNDMDVLYFDTSENMTIFQLEYL